MLPLPRLLNTTEKGLAFMTAQDDSSEFRGWPWSMAAAFVLGDLEAARRIWPDTARPPRFSPAPPGSRNPWHRYRKIGPPLFADDRDALARLLHRWEAENVMGEVVEPYWQPTPFPLERAT
jgi:hypothetical protein